MIRTAAIALGSNLDSAYGSREANLREALRRASAHGRVTAVSSFIETTPVGYLDQPAFLNGAFLLQTELPPEALLQGLLHIERAMGRDRAHAVAKGPRVIDLDLLLMDSLVLQTPNLTLPHPELVNRRFVLEPLAEIAPAMIHPQQKTTIQQLLNHLR